LYTDIDISSSSKEDTGTAIGIGTGTGTGAGENGSITSLHCKTPGYMQLIYSS
jgi:hypothetical protein